MMNTNNHITIYFNDIDENEMNIFNRVISFNATHGQNITIHDTIEQANIIVSNHEDYASIDCDVKKVTHIVLSNDEACDLGDLQITRPLMITKVMNTLSNAIKNKSKKMSTVSDTKSVSSHTHTNTIASVTTDTLSSNTSDHKALVIDDSAAIRKQLELELRDAEIQADFAESGEDALRMVKNNHYDLIFLDIIMPGIDGYNTCQAMRAIPAYKKTPIIMLSGKTSPLDEVKGVIAGATTYLTKPVESGKMQETLNRVTKWIENYAPVNTC